MTTTPTTQPPSQPTTPSTEAPAAPPAPAASPPAGETASDVAKRLLTAEGVVLGF